MKLFTNKNIIQKMTIVLVILMLFNFILPNYARAETGIEKAGKVIFTPVRGLLVMVSDGIMSGLQYLLRVNEKAVISNSDQIAQAKKFIGENEHKEGFGAYLFGDLVADIEGFTEGEDEPNFKYTPQFIFENKIKSFDINFIKGRPTTENNTDNTDSTNDTNTDNNDNNNDTAEWYKTYQMIVDKSKNILSTAKAGEAENGASRIVLKRLGIDPDGTITCNYETAKSAVAKLAESWYNDGESIYEILGMNLEGTEEEKKIVDENAISSNIASMLFDYKSEEGVSSEPIKFSKTDIDYDANAPANALHDIISTWYRIMRNIALIFFLSILVYIGIRIMVASTAADNTKYKKMLISWVVALCILFALHYIMAFTNTIVDVVVSAFATSDSVETDAVFDSVRTNLMSESLSDQVFYTILYLVLVIYTVVFTYQYLKRVVYAAFLTLIAPLVALTYPMDKIGDGKSQAFDFWLKEYILNAIIQPVHLLIYIVLISSVSSLASTNPLYAIVVMGAMMPAEKFIREMFGLNSQKGPGPAGSFAGGAMAASMFNKMLGKPPLPPHHKSDGASTGNGKDKESKEKSKIRMNDDTTSDLAKTVAGQGKSLNSKSVEDKPDIDDGNFQTSRDNNQDNTEDNEQVEPIRTAEGGKNQMDGIDTPTDEAIDTQLGPAGTNEGGENETDEENKNEKGSESSTKDSANNAQQTPDGRDIKSMYIGPKDDKAIEKETKKQNKKTLRQQKKSAKKAAQKRHYSAINKQQAKQLLGFGKGLARGALKAAGAVTLGAAGATVGIAGAISTGDPSNLAKLGGAGALAGAHGGAAIGNSLYESAENKISNGIKNYKDYREDYKNDLYNHSELYREQVRAKEAKKFAKSGETKAAIKARFGHLKNFKMENVQEAFRDYSKNGITDLDTMLNTYGLEQGIDADGNKFAEPGAVSREKAILAGKMAESYEFNNASARKSAKDDLILDLANGYHENSYDEETQEYKLSEYESKKLGKADAKEMMKLVDMAQGIENSKAGLADNKEKIKKDSEDAKAREEYLEKLAIEDEYRQKQAEQAENTSSNPKPRNKKTTSKSKNKKTNKNKRK